MIKLAKFKKIIINYFLVMNNNFIFLKYKKGLYQNIIIKLENILLELLNSKIHLDILLILFESFIKSYFDTSPFFISAIYLKFKVEDSY